MVGLTLKKILAEHPGPELEMIEVTTSPARSWKDGIRMIPALRCGDQILAGFTLSRQTICAFLAENQS